MPNRRFSSLLTLVLLASGALGNPVLAQEEQGNDPEAAKVEQVPMRTVLKEVKHINPEDTLELLRVLNVQVAVQRQLGVLALRGSEENLKTALEMVSALDVPPKPAMGVDLRVYLVEAGDLDPEPLPAGVDKALQPLGSLLGLQTFRLLDTIFLRTSEGSRNGQDDGRLTTGAEFKLTFGRVSVLRGEPFIVRLDGLTFECSSPGFSLRTDVEVREGQVAVIGKASVVKGGAVLVVLQADVLDEGDGG